MTDTPVRNLIEQTLVANFPHAQLIIRDDSHKHADHAGSHPQGESHFHVTVIAPSFAGQARIARHRTVNGVLKTLLKERVHALQIFAYTPEEYAAQRA